MNNIERNIEFLKDHKNFLRYDIALPFSYIQRGTFRTDYSPHFTCYFAPFKEHKDKTFYRINRFSDELKPWFSEGMMHEILIKDKDLVITNIVIIGLPRIDAYNMIDMQNPLIAPLIRRLYSTVHIYDNEYSDGDELPAKEFVNTIYDVYGDYLEKLKGDTVIFNHNIT